MFDLNENIQNIKTLPSSNGVYQLDNFFKYPEKIADFLSETPCPLWKKEQGCSYNGMKFIDRRHFIPNNPFKKIVSNVIGFDGGNEECYSNCMTLLDREYNNYKENFWCPHTDSGWMVCMVYLNKNYDGPGTNIYSQIEEDYDNIPEHMIPWRSRKKYKLVTQTQAKFNRFVMFDGDLLHGAAFEDDTFFYIERKNLVSFALKTPS